MVFGIHATGIDHKEYVELRGVDKFIQEREHIKTYALYLDAEAESRSGRRLRFKRTGRITRRFYRYDAYFYPDKEVSLKIETEFV